MANGDVAVASNSENASKALLLGTWAFVLVGAALRIIMFASRNSLIGDELFVTFNLNTRSAAGLLHTLDLQQVAPPVQLLLTKAIVTLFGVSDAAVRAPSLVVGILTIWLAALAGRRLGLPWPVQLFTTGLVACAPSLVDYATLFKPYVWDVMVSLLLLVVYAPHLHDPKRQLRWPEALATVFAILASVPSIFVVACLLAVIIARRQRPARALDVIATGSVAAALFVALYLLSYRDVAADAGMRRFFKGFYVWDVFAARGLPELLYVVLNDFWLSLLSRSVASSASIYVLMSAAVVATCGIVWLVRNRASALAIVLVLIIAAPIAASVLRVYVLAPRLLLVAAPAALILFGCGAFQVTQWLAASRASLVFAAMALPAVGLMARASVAEIAFRSQRGNEGRVIAEVVHRLNSTTAVYIPAMRLPAWMEYSIDWSHRDSARIAAEVQATRALGFNAGNWLPRGHSVHQEGDALQFLVHDTLELYGIPSGTGSTMNGRVSAVSDSGWVENEVRRMRASGRRSIWMLQGRDTPELLAELAHQGVRVRDQLSDRAARAYLLEFPPDSAAREGAPMVASGK